MEVYNDLVAKSKMLDRIAGVVKRYANSPSSTVYECVVKMDARERTLTETVQKLKQKRN
jgi:hypothetical protein